MVKVIVLTEKGNKINKHTYNDILRFVRSVIKNKFKRISIIQGSDLNDPEVFLKSISDSNDVFIITASEDMVVGFTRSNSEKFISEIKSCNEGINVYEEAVKFNETC